MKMPRVQRRPAEFTVAHLLLLLSVLLYVVLFTRLAFALHTGMRTHKADLGQIAQAVWNSSRGRFVEMTDNGFIATRMTDHVEPILAVISPILWIWDDVRALLFLQVLFAAVGAWFVFILTMIQFGKVLSWEQRTRIWEVDTVRSQARPVALALALAFLLAPQLQSALLTEFHAAPLVVPLVLWSFWAVERRRWTQFVISALLVASVKEEMALLAAGLGVWAIWRTLFFPPDDTRPPGDRVTPAATVTSARKRLLSAGLLWGTLVTLIALIWFYIATFVIVPAHAVEVYGIQESGYFQRYGALGDSPVDILTSFVTRPATVWAVATEPARVAYLVDLLAPFGFLSLLAPEVLLLSLPLLLANLLSAYPAQYYGEFHYSAPLVPYVAVAAAYGAGRIWRWAVKRTTRSSAAFQHMPAAGAATMNLVAVFQNARTAVRPLVTVGLVIWILAWAAVAYLHHGRGPLGGRYDPTPLTAHHALLPDLVAQIPDDAAVTATAAVHPHLALRRYVYQFPLGLDAPTPADWALLDVTTNTDMAPGDLKAQVDAMLAGEWGVVDGVDGYLLLRKGAPSNIIPDGFYSFARTVGTAESSVATAPLTFSGLTVDDWPRWRQTKVTGHWQVGAGFDADQHELGFQVTTPSGQILYRYADLMPPALLWYPPARWQPGETIHIATPTLFLPRHWGVVVDPEQPPVAIYARGHDGRLVAGESDTTDSTPVVTWPFQGDPAGAPLQARFRTEQGATLDLAAQVSRPVTWPGGTVDVWLAWQGDDWPAGYVAFVHLRDGAGSNVAQADGLPRFFGHEGEAIPTSQVIPDWRELDVPAEMGVVMPGEILTVVVGLYEPGTGVRAQMLDESDPRVGTEVVVGAVEVQPPPTPDQSCALIPQTCAAQPSHRP